jgi:hypothetical protein
MSQRLGFKEADGVAACSAGWNLVTKSAFAFFLYNQPDAPII